jgi:hypothetical protein
MMFLLSTIALWLVASLLLLSNFSNPDGGAIVIATVFSFLGYLCWQRWQDLHSGVSVQSNTDPLCDQTGFNDTDAAVELVPDALMSEEQALAFWQEMKNHPDLSWDIANTGCEARVDFIAEVADQRGWKPGKVWMFSYSDGHLWAYINKSKTEIASWGFHVALRLPVIKDGDKVDWVFDLTLCDKPLSLGDWFGRFGHGQDNNIYHMSGSWKSYFGYTDMLTEGYREKAVEARTKTLKLLKILDDKLVLEGKTQWRRAEKLDALKAENSKKFKKWKNLGGRFSSWFRSSAKSADIEALLKKHDYYYGIPTDEIIKAIDFNDPVAYVEMIFSFWEDVSCALEKLDSQATILAKQNPHTFGLQWEAIETTQLRSQWFMPYSQALWQQWGISPEQLRHTDKEHISEAIDD